MDAQAETWVKHAPVLTSSLRLASANLRGMQGAFWTPRQRRSLSEMSAGVPAVSLAWSSSSTTT